MNRTARQRRFVIGLGGFLCAMVLFPVRASAQGEPPPAGDVEPLLPPGISDSDLELYGKFGYVWDAPDEAHVVEITGDFVALMGHHRLESRDAVVWFRRLEFQGRTYLDAELFLWQDAEIGQPGGTYESGPALLVTLRTFGALGLNLDSHARKDDSASELYRNGERVRRRLAVAPADAAEVAATPVQVAPSLETLRAALPRPRKMVLYSADRTTHQQRDDQSIVIATGNVYVAQGSPAKSAEYLELRADAAVLYLRAERLDEAAPDLLQEEPPSKTGEPQRAEEIERPPGAVPPREEPKLTEDEERLDRQAVEEWASAVYLEGDVLLTRGQRMIRAARLYYDLEQDRALILDVVTRALEPSRGLPIYVRADVVRQLDARTYSAQEAQITTSEFHTPHVALGAAEVTFEDITPRNEQGEIIGVEAGRYQARHTTFNLEGLPLAYWPYSAGTFSRDRMAFQSAKMGYNSEFGGFIETKWYLFNLLGLETPEGYDATLKLDYFSERGPAIGIDMDYEQNDYYGLVRSYYIHDRGKDDFGGSRGTEEPDTENRGRWLWRHRQFFPEYPGWELTLETSYISDDQYMEEYERNEFENGKLSEDLLYLLKRQDNWQFSLLANWRFNDFQTETEHLPDAQFSLIGEPLGDVATFYGDHRLGVVRYRPGDEEYFLGKGPLTLNDIRQTGSVLRGDAREEVQLPLPELGPIKLTPFLMVRGTAWDDSLDAFGGGGEQRGFGGYGIHSNVIATRTYEDVESEMLDLHRLRHVVKVDASAWNAHTNVGPMELTPFDAGVEDIDDFGGATVGLRQRLQTKRGGAGRRRTVDWIVLDLEAGFFRDSTSDENTDGDFIFARPEDSTSSNFVKANFQYRLSDTTVLVYDGVYDANRGNVGTSNVSLAVEREPRLAYFVGWRYIHDTESNLMAFGANYKLNEKHTLGFRETYDIEEGRNVSTDIIYIRKWPRWHTAVALDVDRTLDDIGINFSAWPEGAPRLGLGSKRYTGLADSVGLDLR